MQGSITGSRAKVARVAAGAHVGGVGAWQRCRVCRGDGGGATPAGDGAGSGRGGPSRTRARLGFPVVARAGAGEYR
jgi:hypothetical protein